MAKHTIVQALHCPMNGRWVARVNVRSSFYMEFYLWEECATDSEIMEFVNKEIDEAAAEYDFPIYDDMDDRRKDVEAMMQKQLRVAHDEYGIPYAELVYKRDNMLYDFSGNYVADNPLNNNIIAYPIRIKDCEMDKREFTNIFD